MRVYSATDVGQKRKMNQDYVFVSENPVGNLPNLFVVADGMGGQKAERARMRAERGESDGLVQVHSRTDCRPQQNRRPANRNKRR